MHLKVPPGSGIPIAISGLEHGFGDKPHSLNVPLIMQEQSRWCWAACTDMVLRFFNATVTSQGELANFLFEQTKCTNSVNDSSVDCNRVCQEDDVVKVHNHVGTSCQLTGDQISQSSLEEEISAGRPVEVAFLWTMGGGHVLVVHGILDDGSVLVNDPWQGAVVIPSFDALKNAYNQGRWAFTWTNFKR